MESVVESLPLISLTMSGVYSSFLLVSFSEALRVLKTAAPPNPNPNPSASSLSASSRIATYMSQSLNPLMTSHSRYAVAKSAFKMSDSQAIKVSAADVMKNAENDKQLLRFFKRSQALRGVFVICGVIGLTCVVASDYYARIYRAQLDVANGRVYLTPIEWREKIFPFRISNSRSLNSSHSRATHNKNCNINRYIPVLFSNQSSDEELEIRISSRKVENDSTKTSFMSFDTFLKNSELVLKDISASRSEGSRGDRREKGKGEGNNLIIDSEIIGKTGTPVFLIEANYCPSNMKSIRNRGGENAQQINADIYSHMEYRRSKSMIESYDLEMFNNLKQFVALSNTNNEVNIAIAHIMNSEVFDEISRSSKSNFDGEYPSSFSLNDNCSVYDLRSYVYHEISSELRKLSDGDRSNLGASITSVTAKQPPVILATSPKRDLLGMNRTAVTSSSGSPTINDTSVEPNVLNSIDRNLNVSPSHSPHPPPIDECAPLESATESSSSSTGIIDSIGSNIRISIVAGVSALSNHCCWIYQGLWLGVSSSSRKTYSYISGQAYGFPGFCWGLYANTIPPIYNAGTYYGGLFVHRSLAVLLSAIDIGYFSMSYAGNLLYDVGTAFHKAGGQIAASVSSVSSSMVPGSLTTLKPKKKCNILIFNDIISKNVLNLSSSSLGMYAVLVEYAIKQMKLDGEVNIIEVEDSLLSSSNSNRNSNSSSIVSSSSSSSSSSAEDLAVDIDDAINVILLPDVFDQGGQNPTGIHPSHEDIFRLLSPRRKANSKAIVLSFSNQVDRPNFDSMPNVKFLYIKDVQERIFQSHARDL